MPQVTYIAQDGSSQIIELPSGENVMHGALFNGVEGIVGECGGALACATCHCYVDEAWADKVGGPASQDEKDMLENVASEVRANSRLSCQIVVSEELDGLIVRTPEAQY
jgi:ferredoxin, 2Fe-2S